MDRENRAAELLVGPAVSYKAAKQTGTTSKLAALRTVQRFFQLKGGLVLSHSQSIQQHFNKRLTYIRRPRGRLCIAGLIGGVLALFLTLSPAVICAGQITLAWDPNFEPDVAGYILYYGTQSRYYDYDVDVGDYTSITISGLVEDVMYYFAVTAYDVEGNESDFSAEITYPNSVSLSDTSGSSGGGGGCYISTASENKAPTSPNYNIKKFALLTLAISLLHRGIRGSKLEL